MHILIVPSEYPTNDHKLGGIFTKEQETYLKRYHKLGVIYVYLFSVKKLFTNLFYNILRCKIKNRLFIYYFPRLPYLKYLNYMTHYFFFRKAFEIYIKKYGKPDLLHVHFSEFAIWTAYKIKNIYNIPYVITEHSTDFLDGKYEKTYPKKSKIYKKIHLAFKNAKQIICVSSILKKKIKFLYKLKDSKLSVIPNLSFDSGLKTVKKVNDLIFVGSFDERKNPMLLLEAFKIIYGKKSKMIMIGGGPLRSKIEEFIEKNKLKNYIKIYPPLNKLSVLKLINKSKILALPSFFETFGIVVIEAYSLGVPVVMTDSLGVRDLYNLKSSILIKKKDPKNFAKGLNKLLNNYNKFEAKKIINFYKKNFSPSVVIDKINSVYKS